MNLVIPYITTKDRGAELRYALRSLKNLTNFTGDVYIIGDKENWFKNIIHIPVFRTRNKPYLDQVLKMQTACSLPAMGDTFIAYMDDLYLTETVEAAIYFTGTLKKNTNSYHQRTKQYTADKLQSMNLPTVDYEAHAPMVVDRVKLNQTLRLILEDDMKQMLQWRSMYGNMWDIGGQLFEDKKTKNLHLKDGPIISTNFYTKELEKLFPEPSKYEIM